MEKENNTESVKNNKSNVSDDIFDMLSSSDPAFLWGMLVGAVVILLTIVFWMWSKRSSSRRSVLLVGLCDSGKSLIFYRLIHRKFISTQTSIVENTAMYEADADKKKMLKLIDMPGHDRVRQQYFDKFKISARGLIFVVDSSTFLKDIKDVAELLYQLLTDRVIAKNAPSLLIACNKSDQAVAKGSKLIQSALEKELNNVRRTRSAALEATDGSAVASAFLGKRDQNFTFADLRPMSVEFVECSATGQNGESEHQLGDIMKWLNRLA